jgi:hypothetical protein
MNKFCFLASFINMILTTLWKQFSLNSDLIHKLSYAWWESTKWISWKEFAQTGPEKVCDKVIINKLE